jgi:hypothetical protein
MTAKEDRPLYPHPVVFTLLPWLLFLVFGTVRVYCLKEMVKKKDRRYHSRQCYPLHGVIYSTPP